MKIRYGDLKTWYEQVLADPEVMEIQGGYTCILGEDLFYDDLEQLNDNDIVEIKFGYIEYHDGKDVDIIKSINKVLKLNQYDTITVRIPKEDSKEFKTLIKERNWKILR